MRACMHACVCVCMCVWHICNTVLIVKRMTKILCVNVILHWFGFFIPLRNLKSYSNAAMFVNHWRCRQEYIEVTELFNDGGRSTWNSPIFSPPTLPSCLYSSLGALNCSHLLSCRNSFVINPIANKLYIRASNPDSLQELIAVGIHI